MPAYLIFVIFFTRAKFLENKIYTEIANLHSKLPIFRVKSVKIYTGKKNLHGYTRGIRDKLEVWVWYVNDNTRPLAAAGDYAPDSYVTRYKNKLGSRVKFFRGKWFPKHEMLQYISFMCW